MTIRNFYESQECAYLEKHPIVYLCAEYALDDKMPIYAGGLGVLAGDMIREAAEEKIPLITLGLYYHEGYAYHDLYPEGIMMKGAKRTSPSSTDLLPVVDKDNNRIIITLPIQETTVYVQAWSLKIGSVTLYLLDTAL